MTRLHELCTHPFWWNVDWFQASNAAPMVWLWRVDRAGPSHDAGFLLTGHVFTPARNMLLRSVYIGADEIFYRATVGDWRKANLRGCLAPADVERVLLWGA